MFTRVVELTTKSGKSKELTNTINEKSLSPTKLLCQHSGCRVKPTESPLSSHLYGLASHLVYGVSTEIARRGLRAAL